MKRVSPYKLMSAPGVWLHSCPWDPADPFPNISSAQNLCPFASESSTRLFVEETGWIKPVSSFSDTQLNYSQLPFTLLIPYIL